MPVQTIYKSHKDPIQTKQAMLGTRSNMVFLGTQGQVTQIWPEFELVWGFMTVLVTFKFEVKSDGVILRITFCLL